MTNQFQEFKKCIHWTRNFDGWCGSFGYKNKGIQFCFSIQAEHGATAREAKASVSQMLYDKVAEYCLLKNLSMEEMIKSKLSTPARKKGR